jgi:hypothetical protein
MDTEGPKRVLLVNSQRSFDRREVVGAVSDRCEVLPTLTINTAGEGEEDDTATFNVLYRPGPVDRPGSDELIVHLLDSGASKVLHFTDVLRGPIQPGIGPQRPLDIVDRVREYRALLDQPCGVSGPARQVLKECVNVVETRNYRADLARASLKRLVEMPGMPPDIAEVLKEGEIWDAGGPGLHALTRAVEYARTLNGWPEAADAGAPPEAVLPLPAATSLLRQQFGETAQVDVSAADDQANAAALQLEPARLGAGE